MQLVRCCHTQISGSETFVSTLKKLIRLTSPVVPRPVRCNTVLLSCHVNNGWRSASNGHVTLTAKRVVSRRPSACLANRRARLALTYLTDRCAKDRLSLPTVSVLLLTPVERTTKIEGKGKRKKGEENKEERGTLEGGSKKRAKEKEKQIYFFEGQVRER